MQMSKLNLDFVSLGILKIESEHWLIYFLCYDNPIVNMKDPRTHIKRAKTAIKKNPNSFYTWEAPDFSRYFNSNKVLILSNLVFIYCQGKAYAR